MSIVPSAMSAWRHSPRQINKTFLFALLALMAMFSIGMAVAGGAGGVVGGAEFQPLYNMLVEWMTGYLGRVVAIVFIVIGLIAGAARGNIMGFALGIAAGMGMFLAPPIIESVVAATLPVIA